MPPNPSLTRRVLVVGEVIVDQHLDVDVVRLGGVFHSARALSALGVTYGVAYVGPEYLRLSIEEYLGKLGAQVYREVGRTIGSPSVMLIRESTEAGDQGYLEILHKQAEVTWQEDALLALLQDFAPTDALVVPGHFPLDPLLNTLLEREVSVHLDIQYAVDVATLSQALRAPLSTIFCSTSAATFQDNAEGNPVRLRELIPESLATSLVLKENRGGSRVYSANPYPATEGPAFPTVTAHSVGVGDCFNAAWITRAGTEPPEKTLTRAAYQATLYASTFNQEEYEMLAQGALANDAAVVELVGTRLPWEQRASLEIYLAAPDFPGVDVGPLDQLEAALRYHNFRPRRPVKENGLHTTDTSPSDAQRMYEGDLSMISSCAMMIGVPLTFDAGMFVEIGMAVERGMPTVLYDPHNRINNLFTTKSVGKVCRTMGEVMDEVFEMLGKARHSGEVR